MKLITEATFNDIETTLLENESGGKDLYIGGVFMQDSIVNGNKRRYPKAILSEQVKKYVNEFIDTKRALGELEHPKSHSINLDRVSHRTVSLTEEGNDYIGKAIVTNTPCGNIIKGIHEAGGIIGVSSRAVGSVQAVGGISEVQSDYRLITIDSVFNPSAPAAFVNGIMEGMDFEINEDDTIVKAAICQLKKEVKALPKIRLAEGYDEAFKRFVRRSLSRL